MCLAVPGKIVKILEEHADPLQGRLATVDFQGNTMDVSLNFVPEAGVGDWVLVHAGFAINQLDEEDARETWEYLKQIADLDLPGEGIADEER
jgi:hydrogenase expression/formation protein HypC